MLSRESGLRLILGQNSCLFKTNISWLRTNVCTGLNGRVSPLQYNLRNQFSFSFQSSRNQRVENYDDFEEESVRQPRRGRILEFSNIQWNKETLIPFQKHFYQEHPGVARRNVEEVNKMRREAKMLVFGNNLPKPFQNWEESGIPGFFFFFFYQRRGGKKKFQEGYPLARPEISRNFLHIGEKKKSNIYLHPTPIQQQGIPLALSGNDVVGISRTGSGKTLTYVLPLLVHVEAQPVVQQGDGPIGLILAPTRELAQQINSEIEKYAKANIDIILKHTAVYGGTDRSQQIRKLQTWPDILVATPGRLLDLASAGMTNFKRTTYLVLDEADRMLHMGFRRDLEKILSYIRPDKQVLMWSATWPPEIQQIAQQFMKNPFGVQLAAPICTPMIKSIRISNFSPNRIKKESSLMTLRRSQRKKKSAWCLSIKRLLQIFWKEFG
ncbi:hypothetical protein RFI_08969 [Reticulomyxa filosa]|uniref:Helicase ATP-binding domain-containing protein n=1 Tax=Reticulomyxa filosa TaxID=46433 RepID=X6NQG9_RETFI|nr:hypothetical protein RFI_08969 [Reticulomyxa filosa]|eukprot:ETO28163.1 hypothetical protein RFI_08969 [Reticulomyxa filosa]